MKIFDEAKEHFKNLQRDITSTANVLIKSSTKWGKISSVPSVDVDIVLIFPSGSDMDFIQWFMMELVDNVPELSFSLNYHRKADEYALYLTASYKNLLRGAELLNIRKKVILEFGGGYREFNLEELDLFQDVSEEELFLSSQERQSIVMYWLNSLRSRSASNKYCKSVLEGQSLVPILVAEHKISQIFPLHNLDMLKQLGETWVTKFRNPQPLNDIAGYFGVKLALYFAWLGHYTTALLIPTIVGVIGWQLTDKNNHDIYYMFTALFNIIWVTLYLKHWRRTCSALTYKWGTIDYQIEMLCDERPSFKGTPKICPITNRQIRYYPNWKRLLKVYFVSIPVIFFSFFTIIKVSLLFSSFQVYLDKIIAETAWENYLSHIPKIMHALVIGFMDDCFKKVAQKLNKFENHRLEESYRNHLMVKLILFQFMNSFFSLFYIAFYLRDLVKLREQLATLLITRQFIGNIKEVVMPFVNTKVRQMLIGIRYEQRKNNSREKMKKSMEINTKSDNTFDGISADVSGIKESCPSSSIIRPNNLSLSEDNSIKYQGEAEVTHEDNIPAATIGDNPTEIPNDNDVRRRPNIRCRNKDKIGLKNPNRKTPTESFESKRSSTCALTPGEVTLYQAEEEATLPRYDDPFEDFLEMFIQFGYVSMFACAFPLAGLFCLLNNILEIRSDAFKLISSYQRPFGANVPSIGVWQMALEGLSYVAVAVNMGLLAVSGGLGRLLEGYSLVYVIVAIVIIEHFVLVIKFLLEQSIPNVPYWIEQERCVIEHKRREALKAMEKEAMKERRRHRGHSYDPLDKQNDKRDDDCGTGMVTRKMSNLC